MVYEPAKRFSDLEVWKEAHSFVVQLYKDTENFPSKEQFGLTNQMRRAAVSISSNIAEGFGRRSEKDKVRFYDMAVGSLNEIQSQLLISKDLQYLKSDKFLILQNKTTVVYRLLNGLIRSIRF